MVLRRDLTPDAARRALFSYAQLPLVRHEDLPFLPRWFDLRDRFTAYDAGYVALAERLGDPLVTIDGRLTRGAVKLGTVEVLFA